MKKISIKNAKLKILSGTIAHIGLFKPEILRESSFPIKLIIVDEETMEEFPSELVSCLPFSRVIPDVAAYVSEGVAPEKCTAELLLKNKVTDVNQLALYIYVRSIC